MKSVARRGHKKASSASAGVVVNRRATYDYQLSDRLTVGLSLTGMEAKAARLGHVSLRGAYVVPKRNIQTGRDELFLINASFTLNNNAPKGSGQSRTIIDTGARRILAKRREIERLVDRKSEGLTIVPLKLLTHGRYVKLELAAGKGKKRYDKRRAVQERDIKRELAQQRKR